MKRQIIIILITLSIFGANLSATANIFIKDDLHNNFCSLHEYQHTHNSLEQMHGHNHKVNSIDFYISEGIQIETLFYTKEDHFYFTKQYNYSISKERFRPPIV